MEPKRSDREVNGCTQFDPTGRKVHPKLLAGASPIQKTSNPFLLKLGLDAVGVECALMLLEEGPNRKTRHST